MFSLKRLIRLALVVAVAALAALYAVSVARQAPVPVPLASPLPSEPDNTRAAELALEDQTRRLAMQVAYADLEEERLMLNRQLGALNAKLWGRRLPAAHAQSIQEDMMAAKSLLTNPPLLGAFLDVGGIQHERDRLQASMARLQKVESELGAGQ